jgi:transposase
MRKKKPITLANKPTYQGYSYGFKVAIIECIENGQISQNQAAIEYEVSRGSIQKWIKKYGNLDKKLRDMGGKSPQQKIKELQKKLKEAEQKVLIWEATMEIVEDEYGVDVKKKFLNDSQREVLYRINKNSKEQ